MKFTISGLAAVAAASALVAPAADAAPVTVQLRVEGANRTLFEGRVTTDVRTFHFTNDATQHQCDATAANGGPSSTAQPTRGGAIVTAAEQNGFDLLGAWSDSFGSPSFTEVAGEHVDYDPNTGRYLAEYKDGVASNYGSCGDPIADGDDVVYAYATGSENVLKLAGPATASPGQAVAVKVTDEASGAPVSGASVDGRTTGGDGTASVGPYDTRGDHALKATHNGSIRSNALHVCVTDGADGYCGTTAPSGGGTPSGDGASSDSTTTSAPSDSGSPPQATSEPSITRDVTAPRGRLAIPEGRVYAHGQGPRVLKGTVPADPSGLLMVKLRLTRNDGGRCSGYSSRRERFIATRCGVAHGWYFKLGSAADWSYLLPAKLGPGRYVLDVDAIDKAYNRDDQRRRGENRVVFTVR